MVQMSTGLTHIPYSILETSTYVIVCDLEDISTLQSGRPALLLPSRLSDGFQIPST